MLVPFLSETSNTDVGKAPASRKAETAETDQKSFGDHFEDTASADAPVEDETIEVQRPDVKTKDGDETELRADQPISEELTDDEDAPDLSFAEPDDKAPSPEPLTLPQPASAEVDEVPSENGPEDRRATAPAVPGTEISVEAGDATETTSKSQIPPATEVFWATALTSKEEIAQPKTPLPIASPVQASTPDKTSDVLAVDLPKATNVDPSSLALPTKDQPSTTTLQAAPNPQLQQVALPKASEAATPLIPREAAHSRAEVASVAAPTPPTAAPMPTSNPPSAMPSAGPPLGLTIAPIAEPQRSLKSDRAPDLELVWDTTRSTQAPGTDPKAATPRAELPQALARAVVEALHRRPDGLVEIALSPRELGAVRMSISPAEQGVVVSIMAERPETLDLMRRNIDGLGREFAEMGYENISFSFSTNGEQAQDMSGGDQNGAQSHLLTLTEFEEEVPQMQLRQAPSPNCVDIRL